MLLSGASNSPYFVPSGASFQPQGGGSWMYMCLKPLEVNTPKLAKDLIMVEAKY